jgi:carboxypeptidase C (cathepsin A)
MRFREAFISGCTILAGRDFPQHFFDEGPIVRSIFLTLAAACILIPSSFAQQAASPKTQNQKKPATTVTTEPAENTASKPEAPSDQRPSAPQVNADRDKDKEERFDMTEVPPIITHHQVTVDGKALKYTSIAGRLPIKRGDGKIEAEMFYVSYALDGQDAAKRPLTFAFNGGPGSASIWLHMGALGPRRVVLQPDGFMPAAPYRMEDNPYTLLDKSDLVLIDAIGTGFSRAGDSELFKKFWGVKGDIEAFSEFIRLYITRNERWSSPLFILGESYGTTRAAGIAGYLADRGISFNGITLALKRIEF